MVDIELLPLIEVNVKIYRPEKVKILFGVNIIVFSIQYQILLQTK